MSLPPPPAPPPSTIPGPSGITSAMSGSLTLDEEQKRWLVVGICLHKVLLPPLRSYIKPEIDNHYSNLKTNHNIDKQTSSKFLKKDATITLNYGSINNNEANHRKVAKKYDYRVKSEIDLAKLYLKPYMAKFSGFDDTCDLSAVLGIIASASIFTAHVQKFAMDVRQDVRNVWGHCNFTQWTEIKFAKSFQLMDSFLRSISLTPAEEKKLINELSDWETKGMNLCLGHIVDEDLVKVIEQEVSQLSKQMQIMETYQRDQAKRVYKALKLIIDAIEKFKEDISPRVESLEKSQLTLKQEIDVLKSDLDGRLGQFDIRVKTLEVSIENKSATKLLDTFLAPNRIPSFYGRSLELASLGQCFEDKGTPCIISAICGLGGTGKTSLAIEHVWKNKELYKGGVFWLSGESVSHFQNTISEMARELGTFDDDFRKMMSGTLDWLKKRRELWCIVIDNLDEYDLNDEMLKFFTGHWKHNATGHMLITTRREIKKIQNDIPEALNEHCIELESFSEEESSQFLKLRSNQVVGDYNDEKTLKELSLMLGYLPLALDQAAAYIKHTGVQFSGYLELVKKQKLDTLKRSKAHYPAEDTSMERVAVHTTWKLNFEYVNRLSEECGIGQAAALVMNVSAFLSPDDIPLEIINKGLPEVEQEDLHNCLSLQTGVADIVSVLTNFSLFQRFNDKSVSIHQLVQEVIRKNISEDDKTKVVLQTASRMLHRAFIDTNSPRSICQSFQGDSVFNHKKPPSLHLWGKLSSHANVLRSHLIDACNLNNSLRQDLINTEEAAFLFNEASLYLSVCRQKVQAMELQKAKLKILTTLNMSQEKLSHFQYFDIPLKNFEFKLISHCMRSQEQSQTSSRKLVNEGNDCQAKADKWREQGNLAFKSQDYQQALDCYNVAFKWNSNDCRVLCNRALCYLKIKEPEKALEDCEKCLELEKHNKKALKSKALALFEISKTNTDMRERAEGVAAFAAHVDPVALKDTVFTKMFPDLCNRIEIFNPTQLVARLLYLNVNTTFLLHDGYYDLQGAVIDKNVRFVAIDGEVYVKFGEHVHLYDCNLCAEGIHFPRGSGGIKCERRGSVTMFKCHISCGAKSCEKFPECNGGAGCVAGLVPGRQLCDRTGKFGEGIPSGVPGFPAITILEHCTGYFENCEIERCGGGGILCHGKGSRMYVKGCKVHHNHQSGLEAREGGRLEAIDNDIYSNGFQGILLGPSASASNIVQNRIYENSKEGVLVPRSANEEMKIVRSQIHHNLSLGISLDRCQVQIKQNDIFENGFYGIHAKNLTTALVENNDIYSNKCGGIHMGMNFSGRVIIASNFIRNHSGPWLSKPDKSLEIGLSKKKSNKMKRRPAWFLPEGESRFYSNPPILKNNTIKQLEEGIFHPKKRVELLSNECGYCHDTQMLSKCPRCSIASYCSLSCQEKHWDKHKMLCSSVSEKYFVIVDLYKKILKGVFYFDLKGIRTGAKPDPKSGRRFIVKIQTYHLNCHPLQMLSLYDRSTSVYGQIQSPELFHLIMECGVLGKMLEFTSKKAFFYATFVDRNPKKLKIYLAELAEYQDW